MTQERFKEFLRSMEEVHASKNQQYAGKNGYLSNLKMCEAMGIPAWKGVVMRMTDKMARLMNLSNSGGSEIEGAIKDTFIDMAVYSGMGLIAFEDHLSGDRDTRSGDKKPARTRVRRKRRTNESPESPKGSGEDMEAGA
jgi:hypothetical protein